MYARIYVPSLSAKDAGSREIRAPMASGCLRTQHMVYVSARFREFFLVVFVESLCVYVLVCYTDTVRVSAHAVKKGRVESVAVAKPRRGRSRAGERLRVPRCLPRFLRFGALFRHETLQVVSLMCFVCPWRFLAR